jgi:hypothetical protein
MEKIIDPGNCIKYKIENEIFGQFYNSYDKTVHLAKYIPYFRPPEIYLCNKRGNFSPTSVNDLQLCENCFIELKKIAEELK